MRSPSQLSTPLYSQLILRIYAVTNGLSGGAQIDCPRAQETWVGHWIVIVIEMSAKPIHPFKISEQNLIKPLHHIRGPLRGSRTPLNYIHGPQARNPCSNQSSTIFLRLHEVYVDSRI